MNAACCVSLDTLLQCNVHCVHCVQCFSMYCAMCTVLCEMCTVYTGICVPHHCFVQPVLCFAVHPDWGTKEQRRVPPSPHVLYPAIAFNAINTLLPDKPQQSKSSNLIRLTENISLSGTSN